MSKKTANKIIIFDLDGTLIHSIPDMCIAMNKTLEQFKLKSITEEKLQEFVGEGMLKLSENVLKFSGANLNLIDDFFLMYRKEYFENPYYLTTLMTGVKSPIKPSALISEVRLALSMIFAPQRMNALLPSEKHF